MAVETPSVQYNEMKLKGSWDLLEALLGGTRTMRAAGVAFLPREPEEKDKNYEIRLARSFLYNAFKDTIEKLVARPFSRPATWDVKAPEAKTAIEPVMEDMDGEGQHHQEFAKEYLRQLLRWGVVHGYSDFPTVDDKENVNQEQADELELRPTNSILSAPVVIGWKTEKKVNGTDRVIQIRIKEGFVEDKDDWEQEVFDQIRVITVEAATDGQKAKATIDIYRREKKKKGPQGPTTAEYKKVDDETREIVMDGTTPAQIPMTTAYADKTGLMTALPPLHELAWTNLEHWQSASDQKNILRFDRFGILFAAGFEEEDLKKGLKIAPTQAFGTSNENAKLSRVETNGKPAENGWKDLRDIMERLEVLGMDPMIQRLAHVKATGMNINESKSRSKMESWIDAIELAMRQLMQLDLLWLGHDVPLDDIEYHIYKDFVFGIAASAEIKDVIEARKMGDLGHIDFIKEMQRYGRLSDDDAASIAARAQADQGLGAGLFGEGGETAGGIPVGGGAAIIEGQETVGAGI